MIALTLDKADAFVTKLQRKNVNVRWNGWNMVFLKADKRAVRSTDGRFQNGEWGFERVISPDESGRWLVPYGLTKGPNA